jgi:hypothetical protein
MYRPLRVFTLFSLADRRDILNTLLYFYILEMEAGTFNLILAAVLLIIGLNLHRSYDLIVLNRRILEERFIVKRM